MTEQVEENLPKKKSNGPLWALIIMCAFPYVGATLYYQYIDKFPSAKTTNYGTILSPVIPVKDIFFEKKDGSQISITDFQKKWTFLYFIDSECNEPCKKDLYFLGQIRKAMANDRYRINRLIITADKEMYNQSIKNMDTEYPGSEPLLIDKQGLTQFQSYTTQKVDSGFYNHFYLIDPIGNLMMIYPEQADPYKILKDVKKLLKISRIG